MPGVDEFAQPILLFQGGVQVDWPHPVEGGPHRTTLAGSLLEEPPECLSASLAEGVFLGPHEQVPLTL